MLVPQWHGLVRVGCRCVWREVEVKGHGNQPAGLPESKEQITLESVWGDIMLWVICPFRARSQPEMKAGVVSRTENLRGRSQSRFGSKRVKERAFFFSRYSLSIYCRPGYMRVLSLLSVLI